MEVELPHKMVKIYEKDQFLGPICAAKTGYLPNGRILRARVEQLVPLFRIKDGLTYFENKICIPQKNAANLLRLVHDCKIAGHFTAAKTLSRLQNVHRRNKTKDVEEYCLGCLTCQTMKDGRIKRLVEPQPLEIPQSRWGSIAMDFVTHLPLTKR